MDEVSRRALLSGAGLAVTGLLAGCNAPTSGRPPSPAPTPTREPTPTPTETPEPGPERPAFWEWLPRPAALGGGYSFGSLSVTEMRSADLARDRLAPSRFTPQQVHDVVASTTDLLTVSSGSAAGGVLQGQYDPEALVVAFESAGLSADGDGVYTGDRLGFAIDGAQVRWADHPERPAEVLAVLGAQLEGDRDSYPATTAAVKRVLAAIRGAAARFSRPLVVEDGPFASAQFLANGIGTSGGAVTWRSAIAFDGDVPAAAADEYRQEFVDREGFENVQGRSDPGLLVIESEVSPDRATATQPL